MINQSVRRQNASTYILKFIKDKPILYSLKCFEDKIVDLSGKQNKTKLQWLIKLIYYNRRLVGTDNIHIKIKKNNVTIA